ncbi:hypothetical protein QQF64_004091 [Cirrhinus molitorella]|uniref:Uncharacterized protein n=1 Tax=Cirrhinus molitorella TaxID=172907 RepID=A0ABR3MN81_9TELE
MQSSHIFQSFQDCQLETACFKRQRWKIRTAETLSFLLMDGLAGGKEVHAQYTACLLCSGAPWSPLQDRLTCP